MNGKKWSIIDTVVTTTCGILGLLGIVTGIKSQTYNEERQYEELEKRYGLTPVSTEEDK